MKNLLITAFIAANAPIAGAIPTEELTFNCSGTAVITATSDPAFSPFRPAQHRAPDFPAQAQFKATVKVASLDDSCEVLASKYKIDIWQNELAASVELSPAIDLGTTASMAAAAVGQTVSFKLQQKFAYVTAGKYLPLFPDVHGEKIILLGQLKLGPGNAAFTANVPFHIHHAYGIHPLAGKSDKQKVALAKRTIGLLEGLENEGKLTADCDLMELFFELEPSATLWKGDYANLIWWLFNSLNNTLSYQFFNFHVGGHGSRVGAPFAQKLAQLSQLPDVLTDDDKIDLAYAYPTLFLATGVFADEECFAISSEGLHTVLQKSLDDLAIMNWQHQSMLTELVRMSAGGLANGHCVQRLLTPASQELLNELTKELSF